MTTQTGFKQDVQGSYIEKDPAAQLIYTLDWSNWLDSGDHLANSVFTVDTIAGASNVTVVTSGIQHNTHAYVELAGGTAGHTYTVTNTITTVNSATDVRRFKLKVVNRYL